MNKQDLIELKKAQTILENPGFIIKVVNYFGRPIELVFEKIDSEIVNKATKKALETSLKTAINSINTNKLKTPNKKWHKFLSAASGAGGGFFGMAGLPFELPISTTIILRSIAEIAHYHGHNLNDRETQFACLEVFSLGSSKTKTDDSADSAYFAARGALAYEMKLAVESVKGMSEKAIQEALAKGQMPILVKLINSIASRFGVTVSEKLIAQSVPFIGAAGGATINTLFAHHFQEMAEGHFIVKKLEKKYGEDVVKEYYNRLLKENILIEK